MPDARPSYHVRWMVSRDVEAVAHIDAANDDGWVPDDILNTLRVRNVIGMVVEPRDRILGFMVYELFRDRIDLLRIAVDREYRGCDVGTALLDKLKYKVESHGRERLTLTAPEAASGFHLFLRANGFRATACAPGGYVFEWRVPGATPRVSLSRNARLGGE